MEGMVLGRDLCNNFMSIVTAPAKASVSTETVTAACMMDGCIYSNIPHFPAYCFNARTAVSPAA
jgi:hypothetical protein